MKRWAARLVLASAMLSGASISADAACTISALGVRFGTYDVFSSTPLDSDGAITYRCTTVQPIQITLSNGTSGNRSLQGSGVALRYQLYLDAARTVAWGDGMGGTVYTDAAPPLNQNRSLTIFGRIGAHQDVRAGSYTDTVVVIVNF